MRALLIVLSTASLASGCAGTGSYIYQPTANATASAGGFPAAAYEYPAGQPMGDVKVASFGVTEIEPQSGGGRFRVLQVRMVITNRSDAVDWSIDTRQVLATIEAQGQSRPAFVNTDVGAPPVVRINRGQQGVIDLYYPLPPNLTGAEELPGFAVSWQVQTGTGVLARQTPFQRAEVAEDAYARSYYGPRQTYGYPDVAVGLSLGFGPYWWYNPWYPSATFHHRPAVIVRPGPYRVYGGYYGGYRPYPYRGDRAYRPWGGYRGGYYRGYRR